MIERTKELIEAILEPRDFDIGINPLMNAEAAENHRRYWHDAATKIIDRWLKEWANNIEEERREYERTRP